MQLLAYDRSPWRPEYIRIKAADSETGGDQSANWIFLLNILNRRGRRQGYEDRTSERAYKIF